MHTGHLTLYGKFYYNSFNWRIRKALRAVGVLP